MTEKIKESISALIDDEISEIEVHRLLRQYSENPNIRKDWIQYQQVRSVVRKEAILPTSLHLDLNDRISAAIDAEPNYDGSSIAAPTKTASKINWYKPATGFAVAASLAMAIFVGVQQQTREAATAPSFAQTTSPDASVNSGAQNSARGAIQTMPVNTGSTSSRLDSTNPKAQLNNQMTASALDAPGLSDSLEEMPEALRELSPEAQEQLRQYLMRHERMNRRNQNVRTVTYDKAQGKP